MLMVVKVITEQIIVKFCMYAHNLHKNSPNLHENEKKAANWKYKDTQKIRPLIQNYWYDYTGCMSLFGHYFVAYRKVFSRPIKPIIFTMTPVEHHQGCIECRFHISRIQEHENSQFTFGDMFHGQTPNV